MWAVYLAALVVGLGILVLQIVMGAKGAEHHALDEHDLSHEGGKDTDSLAHDAAVLFLSTRFWIYFALAFGLSGSLLNAFALAAPVTIGLLATASGLCAGAFAVLAFRALARSSSNTVPVASEAVGQQGRVLVACAKGKVGQVRIELKGQSVDLLATTDEEEIARGQSVLVEDVRGSIAHVATSPAELLPSGAQTTALPGR